jgi:hypothetical protein
MAADRSTALFWDFQRGAIEPAIVMKRRTVLLFLLFLALAAFYASVTSENVPHIMSEQKNQAETLNRLDEQVLGSAEDKTGEQDR